MSMTGAMMKKVRNRASPNSTWLGGVDWVPMAVRNRLSTMMIRVKLVIISSAAGRNANEVSSNRVCNWIDHC